jgi:hypothetical protein
MQENRTQLIGDLQSFYRELMVLEAAYTSQRICFFRPLPKGDQKRFFAAQLASVRLVLGDNRSGKTECGMMEAISHSLGYRPWLAPDDPLRTVRLSSGRPIPVPNVGRIICQDFTQAVRQNLFPKFELYAPRGWYEIRKDTRGIPIEITWKNGSKIFFMSDDQDDMAFEGTSGSWFWADEPIGYRKYVALRRGLVDFAGHCWLTLTPLTQPWIADVIESRSGDRDSEVEVFRFSIFDNCVDNGGYLTRAAIDSFIADLREDERSVRVGGQWMHLTGRVFREWEPKPPYWIPEYKIPRTWPRVRVIDPHPRKPVAVVWMAVSPDNQVVVYRELFDEGLITIDSVAERIKRLEIDQSTGHREPIVMGLIDPSAHARERTSGDSIMKRFATVGIRCIPAPRTNVEAGLDAIHQALRLRSDWAEPGLVVMNNCPNVKQNFMRYSYDAWASSKQRDLRGERQTVRKTDDDMIDCIRYFYQTGLTYRTLSQALEQEYELMHKQYPGRGMISGAVYGRM